MMNQGREMKKILWAVDAFEERDELQQKAARVLSFFQSKTYAQIEPVFVLGSTEVNWPADSSTDWMHEMEENLRLHLEDVLMASGFPHVLSPKILVEPLSSTSASVETLLEYAQNQRADLIIVSSHGRRGLDRFFLGSFAETLLVHSTIPTLVIGGGAKNVEMQFNHILFPTEFGDHAREAFRRTVAIAKQLDVSVTLFHAVPMPARIVMDTGYYPSMYGIEGEMVTLEDFMRIQGEHQTNRAQLWANWARSEGVKCDVRIDSGGEPVDELICRAGVAEHADLIVMEAQSGALKTALLGSIARNVVRGASCPVLVYPHDMLVRQEVPKAARESAEHVELPHDLGLAFREGVKIHDIEI